MRILKITSLLIVFLVLFSCDSDEDYEVRFTGTVKYASSNSPASGIPIKLIIINNDIPFDRESPDDNKVLSKLAQSTNEGAYNFELNSKDLPRNASYILGVDTDSLLQIDENAVIACMNTGYINKELHLRQEQNDILIDHPAFLQITFDKIDHLSADRIRYSDCLWVRETSMAVPDATFLETRPYFYFKNVHTWTYEILKEGGEVSQRWINSVELQKGDTTKVYIEY